MRVSLLTAQVIGGAEAGAASVSSLLHQRGVRALHFTRSPSLTPRRWARWARRWTFTQGPSSLPEHLAMTTRQYGFPAVTIAHNIYGPRQVGGGGAPLHRPRLAQ